MAVMRKKKKAGRKPANLVGGVARVVGGLAGIALGKMAGEGVYRQDLERRKLFGPGRRLTDKEEAAGKKLVAKNIEKRRKKDIARLSKKSWEDPSKGYGERAYKIADNLRKSRKKKKK